MLRLLVCSVERYDLLSMPMRGVRDMNPLNTVLGIGRGSASFVRHLSVGTLKSFSGWFGSVSKSMDMLVGAFFALVSFFTKKKKQTKKTPDS